MGTHVSILTPEDRRLNVSMANHAPSHPRQGYVLPKKDPPNLGRDMGKRVPDASDDDILKRGGLLDECGLLVLSKQIALVDKLLG